MAGNDCCEVLIGGEVYITARFTKGFGVYEGIGDARIQPSRLERTAGATTAGRLWVTEAARPIRAIMSFANRCDQNPMKLFVERCRIDITIVEKSRGFWHAFTDSVIVGTPEINLASGEISGMEIATDSYYVYTSGQGEQAGLAPEPGLLPGGGGPRLAA